MMITLGSVLMLRSVLGGKMSAYAPADNAMLTHAAYAVTTSITYQAYLHTGPGARKFLRSMISTGVFRTITSNRAD